MICKHCGLAIHKCSSADEYHADDKMEYIKELNGSGCIHEPVFRPTQREVGRFTKRAVREGNQVFGKVASGHAWRKSPLTQTVGLLSKGE